MSGSGGYFASPAPAMSKVLPPVLVLGVASSEVSSSLSVSKETRAFILKNRDVIKPLFWSMMSSFCILIGCQGNSDAPSGVFLIFPCFLVCKGQMSSRFLRDRTLFHQLGACEYECFRLAGALTADANDRAALLEIFAAGKYLWSSRFCFHLVILGARLLDKHYS